MAASDFLQAGGSLFGGLGGLVGGLFGSSSQETGAKYYKQAAANLRTQAIPQQQAVNDINLTRLTQNTLRQLGTIRADTAANGLAMSGSALDILRASRQSAALDKSLAQLAGNQKIGDLTNQALAYDAQAASAKAQANASKAGGIGGFLGSALTAASFFI